MAKELPKNLACFVCGKENPYGLKLCFKSLDELTVSAKFIPAEHLIGYKGMMHGGIISAVLDDAMDWALYNSTGKLYVTSQLVVDFKKPAPVCEELEVIASSERETDSRIRKIEHAKAQLIDAKGNVIAQATGKFFQIAEEKTKELLSCWEHYNR